MNEKTDRSYNVCGLQKMGNVRTEEKSYGRIHFQPLKMVDHLCV